MLTTQEYIHQGGTKCPSCLSHAIDGFPLQSDLDYAWGDVICLNCGFTWTDFYSLTGSTIPEESP